MKKKIKLHQISNDEMKKVIGKGECRCSCPACGTCGSGLDAYMTPILTTYVVSLRNSLHD